MIRYKHAIPDGIGEVDADGLINDKVFRLPLLGNNDCTDKGRTGRIESRRGDMSGIESSRSLLARCTTNMPSLTGFVEWTPMN